MYNKIIFEPIGVIKTCFDTLTDMPIQPSGANGAPGTIEIKENLIPGLVDLEGFSHIILLYHFHKVTDFKLSVVPFMDNQPHGIFATRAPTRPNAIGISIVKLIRIEWNKLFVEGVDVLNNTPLLDIKPFFPKYDNQQNVKYGWLEGKEGIDISKIKSDGRFVEK